MRIAFAHDHPFLRDSKGAVYTEGKLPYSVFRRYLDVFDEIVVVSRMRELAPDADTSRLTLASGPRVSFAPVPSLSDAVAMVGNRRRARAVMAQVITEVDGVIARLPSEVGALAASTAFRHKIPVAVELVGCTWDAFWNHGTLKGRVYAPFALLRTRSLVRRADAVLYVTQRFLQGRYPSDAITVACSNVDMPFAPESVLSKRLARIGDTQRNRPFVIGMIGALFARYKGFESAITALSILDHEQSAFEFRILGPGDPSAVRRQARVHGLETRLKFSGSVSAGAAVNAWLDDLDLYIQPSLTEGLPRALIEAMARGCPALGSSAGGIPELLDASALHRPGDAAGLARLLQRAFTDLSWQRDQAARNFRVAHAYSSVELEPIRTRFWRLFAEDHGRRSA